MRIAVIGAGAWGTALALQAVRAGNEVTLWARDPAPILASRINPRLPGIALPESLTVTSVMPREAEAVISAVPVQFMRATLAHLHAASPVLIASKGVETGTHALPAEILHDLYPSRPAAIISGPNFAHEVAAGLPAAGVIASDDPALRAQLIAALATPAFRLYGNDDPLGVQLGGAAKNVIAIAAGVVMGAGLGENARAALITRGIAELGRLVGALGGKAETISGLSGLGDLLLTCTGQSSRNYSLGLALGRGLTLAEILAGRAAVTEGVTTAPALLERAGDLDLPICRAVAALLVGAAPLADIINGLLARRLRDE